MTEITVGFEGQKRDLNDLLFDLFEAGLLREGLEKQTPGDATIVLRPMELRKTAFAHVVMEIGLIVGKDVALPLFVAWLYDKWKKNGEKRITVIINAHYYEFNSGPLTKALEEAIRSEDSGTATKQRGDSADS
jgi:hypothetical protein